MAADQTPGITTRSVLELLDDMIVHQRDKCLKIARRLNPHLTPDDIMNSFDWPELRENPQYVWEDGLAAGLEAAHAAIAAQFRNPDPEYQVRRFSTDSPRKD
jgi:hypothetical protein